MLRRVGDFAYTLGPSIKVDDLLSIDFAHQQVLLSTTAVALAST